MHPHIVAAKLCALGYLESSHEHIGLDVQVYKRDLFGYRYIVIRGSNSWLDWRTNISIHPYIYEGYKGNARIHQGFYYAYRAVAEYLFNLASNTKLPIILCGHSSGGAIATIAAVDLNHKLDKEIERGSDGLQAQVSFEVLTFGSPNCGNESFALSAKQKIDLTTYINIGDFVPYLMFWNKPIIKAKYLLGLYLFPHHIDSYVRGVERLHADETSFVKRGNPPRSKSQSQNKPQ